MTTSSPPDPCTYFHFGSPLTQIRVHLAEVGDYLKSAFRIWVTEIRPQFPLRLADPELLCAGETSQTSPPEDCLMLAEVDVPLVNIGPGLNWRVDGTQPVTLMNSIGDSAAHAAAAGVDAKRPARGQIGERYGTNLLTPVLNSRTRSVNFFNGRLLTGKT